MPANKGDIMQMNVHREIYMLPMSQMVMKSMMGIQRECSTDPQYATTEDQLHDTEDDDGTPLLSHERSLLVADSKEQNEDWNHASIFWSRVNCKGNSCNIIIDSGSAMNVISQLAAEKHQLPTEKHKRPYKVAWVDNYSIPVHHHCVVPLRVGKYENTIQCDVIPMNGTQFSFGDRG